MKKGLWIFFRLVAYTCIAAALLQHASVEDILVWLQSNKEVSIAILGFIVISDILPLVIVIIIRSCVEVEKEPHELTQDKYHGLQMIQAELAKHGNRSFLEAIREIIIPVLMDARLNPGRYCKEKDAA